MVERMVGTMEYDSVAWSVDSMVVVKAETRADELVLVKAACWADAMVVLE